MVPFLPHLLAALSPQSGFECPTERRPSVPLTTLISRESPAAMTTLMLGAKISIIQARALGLLLLIPLHQTLIRLVPEAT